jgi:hypothetical protein
MNPTPKTIQISLPGGESWGIRIAEITTRIVQVIEVPRSLSAIDCELKAVTGRILTMIGGLSK